MKAKLQHLMERLQLKPGQFARILEVNPAIISHILAERNKPGVDLLQKILSKFPQVNPDWLLLDSEEMFRTTGTIETFSKPEKDLTPNSNRSLFSSNAHTIEHAEQLPDSQNPHETLNPNTIQSAMLGEFPKSNKPITHVVLFYADGTFENYIPQSNK